LRGRLLLLAVSTAALALTATASAAFAPVRRDFGERTYPLVRHGALRVPAGHASGRLTVVVEMPLPPLARRFGRTLSSASRTHRLDTRTQDSRAYLARLARAQQVALRELKAAIPSAEVTHRYRIVLDGFSVTLPARKLPALARMSFAAKLYPSVRYTEATNTSPAMIGATELQRLTGADGRGMKIAVVDTGVDVSSPYLDPTGFSYPPGFPKGGRKWTTPKVIVARTFPGPGAGKIGHEAFDATEPHGTHVSGIAAGDAGTDAPAGPDHPTVFGLSGVAPRAWIGNYRVFTVPTPIGHVANTPEIVAAFESAVADGMDVINFSGGGAQTDPANDALIDAVKNVAAAGVVPVIAAGNDRDDYGVGSVGSPGTAPDAIAVAAVSNTHDFMPAAHVTAAGAPPFLEQIPVMETGQLPAAWSSVDQRLVDVGSLTGSNGKPVERHLCGPPADVNGLGDPLPSGSLAGAIALVQRGTCTFETKAERAQKAGAIGILIADNRSGEPNGIPVQLPIPSAMVADLDGARLVSFMQGSGGRTTIRVGASIQEIATGRGDTITSFSSAGPTDFGHDLKPDISAPGGQILSSTPPQTTGSTFSVFDGTSMATPHVAGAAALLLELHPGWTPRQVKSALVSTAAPAWADTAQTREAPVLLGGGGLVDLPAASDPRLFTDPTSLSYGDLDVARGARREPLLLTVSDAGDAAGTWQLALAPQAATHGAGIELQGSVDLGPGGIVSVPVTATAAADAEPGTNQGFVVLRRGTIERRVPYAFFVTRPQLPLDARPVPLKKLQTGDTRKGTSRATIYCCPSAPFGPAPDYTGPAVDETGAERVYVTRLDRPAANAGVSILQESPGALVHPWLLGSLDENDVQGYAATPVNVNELMYDAHADIGAAAVVFPRQQELFVSVDSGRDPFTGRSRAGSYVLNSWVNDVTPPAIRLVTTRVPAGRPLVVARVLDLQSGVDPLSVVLSYKRTLLGASAYDPVTGYALFSVPPDAPALKKGTTSGTVSASDFQETKNVSTFGDNVMPNTSYRKVKLKAVAGPAVTWLEPEARGCVRGKVRLAAVAGSTAKVRRVRFFDGGRRIGVDARGTAGVYGVTWKAAGRGRHTLRAVVADAKGHSASARRVVTVGCK
jgi:subtilisin family serine protease